MIIQCQGCASKYFLPEEKVPDDPMKVRCPKCKAVFTLVAPPSPVSTMSSPPPVESRQPAREAPPFADDTLPPIIEETPEPKPARGKGQKGKKGGKPGTADDRAKRLARVLVSDILCYNQEKRDQALLDGNLMTVLGDEIKKSWELYKEKVGDEMASSTDYFKEALNDILANGEKIF